MFFQRNCFEIRLTSIRMPSQRKRNVIKEVSVSKHFDTADSTNSATENHFSSNILKRNFTRPVILDTPIARLLVASSPRGSRDPQILRNIVGLRIDVLDKFY